MEWIPMIFPVIAIIICFVWFKSKTVWWETTVPVIVVAIFILIFKFCAESNLTRDTEYWTSYVVEARYYEAWDEWIERTCEYACGEDCDSDGNNCTTIYCEYDCSYREYHSEYWTVIDNLGNSYNISELEYRKLIKQFNQTPSFVDMHRDYDLNDGDMYNIFWPNTDASIETLITEHTYENRVQISSSVFNYPEVDSTDISRFKLYEYPQVINFNQDHLLGMNDRNIERKLDILNAKLGKKKQVKAFIAIYDGPITAAQSQEAYWKGGNKNEFIVCIGLDKTKHKANWVHIISWNLDKTLNIKVRNYVMSQDTLNMSSLVDYMHIKIDTHFKRQPFSEFSYLKIELTDGQMIAIWITSFILSFGIAMWIILNPITDENQIRRRYY
jgi:hypothetical protein